MGEGSTSVSLDGGSLRSLFQIPVPHAKVVFCGARPIDALPVACAPHGVAPSSADGVVGCEVVGDMELLAKELFLGCANGAWDVSLSQDARRTGLCCCGGM